MFFRNEGKINIYSDKQQEITSYQEICVKINGNRILLVEGNIKHYTEATKFRKGWKAMESINNEEAICCIKILTNVLWGLKYVWYLLNTWQFLKSRRE